MKKFTELVGRKLTFGIATLGGLALLGGCCTTRKGGSETAYYSSTPAPIVYPDGSSGQSAQSSSTGRSESSGNTVVPLYEESVKVGKREVEAGSVHLKKIVKTETVNQPIELRHEEVVIERQPASGQMAQAGGQQFQEQDMVIQLKREEPVVEKQTTATGQIVAQTRSTSEQTNIQSEIRREDVNVVRSGDTGNVRIGQNVQGSSDQSAGGAGESPGGQSSGSMSGTITEPSQLSSSSDASTVVGRSVQFSGLKVQRTIGDRLLVLAPENGTPIYARSTQSVGSIHAGDTVTLTGTVKATPTPGADTNLSEDAVQAIRSQPFYIDAQRIEVSGK